MRNHQRQPNITRIFDTQGGPRKQAINWWRFRPVGATDDLRPTGVRVMVPMRGAKKNPPTGWPEAGFKFFRVI
jgi:hypothetical protein